MLGLASFCAERKFFLKNDDIDTPFKLPLWSQNSYALMSLRNERLDYLSLDGRLV